MPECGRVLMTGDTVGGVWTFSLDLARALCSQGVEVLLATMGHAPSEQQREEAAAIENLRLAGSAYKLEWMDDPWTDVEASGRWLLDLERRFEPDVVHLNTLVHGALRFRVPKVVTAHSCVLSWWAAVKGSPPPAVWDRYRSEVTKSLQSADFVTAPSRAMLRVISEHYGPGLPPNRVVLNGRPESLFGVALKEPFVLSAGRLWDEGKNIATLARVASSLPWPVYLAGESHSPRGESPALGGCRTLGRVAPPALAGWYSRAAIYALPARYEPFGLSVLEAAMSRCALVLGDIDSLRELWDGTAVFVPPDDADRLGAALQELIGDAAAREEMCRRSRARARQHTVERMAGEYSGIFTMLARKRRMACSL